MNEYTIHPLVVAPMVKITFEGVSQEQADNIIKNWDEEAWYQRMISLVEREKRVGTNRAEIPFTLVHINDTPQGRAAGKLAGTFKNAVLANVAPETEDQRYYFELVREEEFWRGLILANKMLGLIPDPLPHCPLREESIKNLTLSTNIDKAMFSLLTEGEALIRELANSKQRGYLFDTPLDLFIQIMQELVHDELAKTFDNKTWEQNPSVVDPIKKRKDPGPQKIARNEHRKWIKFLNGGFNGTPLEEEYLKELEGMEWSGLWILALRGTRYQKPFEQLWKNYIYALREGEELFIPTQFWERGKVSLTRKTSKKSPVKFEVDGRRLNISWA